MITEVLAFGELTSVGEVVSELRDRAEETLDYQVQYVYVTSGDGVLNGVLRLRDLLVSRKATPIRAIMIENPTSVHVQTSLDEIADLFARHAYLAIPVTDDSKRRKGVILRASVDEALESRSQLDHLKSQGIIGGEELRMMPLRVRSRRRLAWLSINIGLNIIAASAIAVYQDTIEAVIALAVFLPIISDMSGCSGN